MNAMLLAAGRGERMRPLTDRCPKPLLTVGGMTLLDWQLQRLEAAGCQRVVINIAWLGARISRHIRQLTKPNLEMVISDEGDQALETAGGVVRALPLLGSDPFWLVNADVWSDFDLSTLPLPDQGHASLVMVANPAHHPAGDFFVENGAVRNAGPGLRMTYAGLGCFHPDFFANQPLSAQPLGPLLRAAAEEGRLNAVIHAGSWWDVGTPARLAALDARLTGG